MIALTLYLSSWQTSRAAQKVALQANYDARVGLTPVNLNALHRAPIDTVSLETLRFRTGTVTGEWLEDAQFVVDNKQQNATPGYHVITPLRLVESSAAPTTTDSSNAAVINTVVLVNRGWVPRSRDYPALPTISPPPQAQNYAGLLVIPTKKYLELGTEVAKQAAASPQATAKTNQVWQNLDVQRIAAATGLELFPLVMLLNSNTASKSDAEVNAKAQTKSNTASTGSAISPIEQVETPDAGADKHRGYAFQWLALAIAVALIWLAVNIKITRHHPT